MPLLISNYQKPTLFFSNHIETIFPVLFRKIYGIQFKRERFELSDGDFLDLDWIKKQQPKLLILSHGLEGSTKSNYLTGFASAAANAGYDVLAWNYRGCSGEINRNFRFYHSGESNDLKLVIEKVISTHNYKSIGLVGFSVGGNITLKYLGEMGTSLHPSIKSAVVFSVPCALQAGAEQMAKPNCKIYMIRFLKNLHKKIISKKEQFSGLINDTDFHKIKNFMEFDERYTAPLHGFKSANHYYESCSSINFIGSISIPTLLVSALNDPFLAKECFPFEQAKSNPLFYLETPKHGGHCGFYKKNDNGNYWSDERAIEFLTPYL